MADVRDRVQLDAARELRAASADAMAAWIASIRPWNYFATLTYDPVKVLRSRGVDVDRPTLQNANPAVQPAFVGISKMRRDAKRFRLDVSRVLEQHVSMVAGIEPHESGSLHAHVLLHMEKGTSGNDIRAVHRSWFPLHGFVLVDPITDVDGATKYVAKFERVASYALKQQGDIVFGVKA